MRDIFNTMIAKILTLLVCFCSFTSELAANTEGFADRSMLKARDALLAGDPDLALSVLNPYLENKSVPNDPQMRLLAARAYLELNHFGEALTHLHGLEESLQDIAPTIWSLQSRAHRGLQAWPAIEDLWLRVLKRDPARALKRKALLGLGDAYFAQQKLRAATSAYKEALRFKLPRQANYVVRYNLAEIAYAAGRFADAAVGYKKLLYLSPHERFSLLAREAYGDMVKSGKAKRLDFNGEMHWLERLIRARQFVRAEQLLVRLAKRIPHKRAKREHQLFSARLFLRRGEPEKALPILQKLQQQAPTLELRYTYTTWLARAYGAQDRFEEAIDIYRDFVRHYPGHVHVREAGYKAAWLAFNGKRYRQAIRLFKDFETRYRYGSDVENARWFQAWCSYRLGDDEVAATYFTQLLAGPLSVAHQQRALYWQAKIHERQGRQEEALRFYQQVVGLGAFTFYGVYAAQEGRKLKAPELLLALRAQEDDEKIADVDIGFWGNLVSNRTQKLLLNPKAELSWRASALNWNSPLGQRTTLLMKLGFHKEAAEVVVDVPGFRSSSRADIVYAKSRLLYALGDFNRAYRLVGSTFRQELKDGPLGQLRELFYLAYPNAYRDAVAVVAKEYDLSPILLLSLIRQESAYDDVAHSYAGAHGLMQIITPTAERIAEEIGQENFQVGELNSPNTNMKFGAWYLNQLLKKFHGNIALALASYNAGPQKVADWLDWSSSLEVEAFIEEIPYRETRLYVKKILRNLVVYSQLYQEGEYELQKRLPVNYLNNINF
ncbi:MAG: transglycosylase SLT domain-containing protein [Myxococcota bacterium]|nr:transglycosylase SLT domain-containing protein [Myxococcota bacterium]